MSKPALPTIGRVVYYYTTGSSREHAAIVADIVDGYTVTLGVFSHSGSVHAATIVKHIDEKGDASSWWDWMPFQKGQAAKTEALEKQLGEATKVA